LAQYWGKQDLEPIEHILSMMYKVVFLVGVLAGCVAAFFPEQFLSIYTGDPQVIKAGAEYLRVLAPSYLMFGITSSTIGVLRSVHTVRIAMAVYLSPFRSTCFSTGCSSSGTWVRRAWRYREPPSAR
jgi:Na+-driven multidrug efflux pump